MRIPKESYSEPQLTVIDFMRKSQLRPRHFDQIKRMRHVWHPSRSRNNVSVWQMQTGLKGIWIDALTQGWKAWNGIRAASGRFYNV